MVDSRIHQRFVSDVERTVAGVHTVRNRPAQGIEGRVRDPWSGGGGGIPREEARRAVFAFSRSVGWRWSPLFCDELPTRDTRRVLNNDDCSGLPPASPGILPAVGRPAGGLLSTLLERQTVVRSSQ